MTKPRTRPPRVTRSDDDLTSEEQANVRAALHFLRKRCGNWAGVAKAIRFNHTHLVDTINERGPVSASMAVRIARLAKVGVDDVLAGKYPAPHTCPTCGHVGIPEEIGAA